MGKHFRIYIIIFCVATSIVNGWAKTKNDPSWEVMIDSSALILKVEITKGGDFEATAKITKTYKGEYEDKELTFSGYSDSRIKMNHLKTDAEYIVFLRNIDGNYKVWSPTSGFLAVEKKNVQYDLLQTTNYFTQEYYSLKDFEAFLEAAIHQEQDRSAYYATKVEVVKKKILYPEVTQHLMMLKIAGYKTYHAEFLEVMFNQDADPRIALARYLDAVHTVEARENLVTLLNDKDEIVAEEAAQALIHFEKEAAGDALLRILKSKDDSTTLRRVNGSISQFKLKVMQCLVTIDYKPAAKLIQEMLKTENAFLLENILGALASLEATGYQMELQRHIDSSNTALYPLIFDHMLSTKLEKSDSLIRIFISNLNRTKDTNYRYLVSSKGLGVFQDSINDTFVLAQLQQLMDTALVLDSAIEMMWYYAYMDYFTKGKVKECKASLRLFTERRIGFEFQQVFADSIYESNVLLKLDPSHELHLFIDYLAEVGDLTDLILIHRMEALCDLHFMTRQHLLKAVNRIEQNLMGLIEG